MRGREEREGGNKRRKRAKRTRRAGREEKRGGKKEYMKRGERWGEGGTGELFRQARSQWRWRGGRGCKESAREKTGEAGEAGEPGETGRDRRGEWFARWEKQETRDRKSVVEGKSGDLGGRRRAEKTRNTHNEIAGNSVRPPART